MNSNPKAAFFDGIADQWDGWEDLPVLRDRLRSGLEAFGVAAGEHVLDIGCGTGNLTLALLERLSDEGRIVAVDIAPRMIAAARRKVSDSRVAWHAVDARRLPLADACCDRAICYSVWPHFDDPAAVAREALRVLRPGGAMHIWHLISRERINSIHAGAGDAVCRDTLAPVQETAGLLEGLGFVVIASSEGDDHYLVTAVKPRG
jgi:ubiquinone/menaquinone biosynthesis C-methylase UbiE